MVDAAEVFELLASLSAKSLVTFDDTGERYRLLESVRQYASERLSGEAEGWRDRHLDYYAALAERAEPHMTSSDQPLWMRRLEAEHDNLRAALLWSRIADPPSDRGLRLVGAVWQFWAIRGYLREGWEWLSAMLAAALPDGELARPRAKALTGAGSLAYYRGDFEAARTLYDKSLAIRRELGDLSGVASMLNNLGNIAHRLCDYRSASDLYQESLGIKRELGDQRGIAASLNNLANLDRDQGDADAARPLYLESLAIYTELGDKIGMGTALSNLGPMECFAGNYSESRQHLANCLIICMDTGSTRDAVFAIEGYAQLAIAEGQVLRAATLWSAAQALREDMGAEMPDHEREWHDAEVAAARAALADDASFDAAWTAGLAMTLDQTVAYALESTVD